MNYQEHIENTLDYIEANLKAELSLADLARAAGYSDYHFLRVFKAVVGLTPADYIRKRRLSEIAREMETNGRAASDIAFEYGFNSKENFTRAFLAEHHVLPTAYRASGNSLKLYDRFVTEAAPFVLTPEIVTLPDFALVGFASDEACAPNFWNKYNCQKLSARLSGGKAVRDYGVSSWNDVEKRVGYFIGIRAKDAAGETAGAQRLEIPGGLYAVFTTPPASHFNFVNTIHRSWHYINHVWLPQSAYRAADGKYQLESYAEASRTYSEDIYIPIERK